MYGTELLNMIAVEWTRRSLLKHFAEQSIGRVSSIFRERITYQFSFFYGRVFFNGHLKGQFPKMISRST